MTSPEARFALGMAHPLRASVMVPPDRSVVAPFRVPAREETIRASLGAARSPVVLYAHVPFCETRCAWCGYATLPHGGDDLLDACVDGLTAELETIAGALPPGTEVAGLDVGGGTPGLLSARHFGRLVDTVARRFRLGPLFEVSTETTPRLAAEDGRKWAAIRAAGVSRVSVGLQTTAPGLLARMGRPQEAGLPRRAVDVLRAAGFPMVNVDLMFGLPGQSLAQWEATVDAAIALAPDVVTTYDTVYKRRPIAARQAPTPAVFGSLYDSAFARLTSAGHASRYGSVNFSRVSGRLGTSRALEGRLLLGLDYAGAGLYASSLVGNTWRFNPSGYASWLTGARAGRLAASDLYALPERHVTAKALLLALTYGFLPRARFGPVLDGSHRGTVDLLVGRGLLRHAPDGLEMGPGSFGSLPGIRASFLPDDALPALSLPLLAEASPRPEVA